jgi:lipoyl(octanoyl) transferase
MTFIVRSLLTLYQNTCCNLTQAMVIQHLGHTEFEKTWRAMQDFTSLRNAQTEDQLWVTEHSPVYTLGLNRRDVRMPTRSDIPVVNTDRGGKITYHGPGQIVIYVLIDLQRKGMNVRQLVSALEGATVNLLAELNIESFARTDAPGVYVQDKKIASVGLRLKNQCCYHGLSLNVDMDLSPFDAIDPCGYQGLEVTQLKDFGLQHSQTEIESKLLKYLTKSLNY